MSKLNLFHSEIVDDYLNQGLGMRDLEKKYGINRKYIRAHFDANSVPRKTHSRIPPHIAEKLADAEWLRDAYDKTHSAKTVAESIGTTKALVLRALKKHGIEKASAKSYWAADKQELKPVEVPIYDTQLSYRSTKPSHKPKDKRLHDRDEVLMVYKELRNIQMLADHYGLAYSTVQNALHFHNIPLMTSGNTSQQEYLIVNALKEFNPIHGHKIGNMEIDIYFPDHGLAVEIHGLRFHSEVSGGKGRSYHQKKYDECTANGIRLLQFYEFEIAANQNLILDMLRVRLGAAKEKLNARSMRLVEGLDVREFLDTNHLQGSASYSKSFALVDDDGIAACMTFIKSRNDGYDWELNRFALRSGSVIRGAFSRLLKARPSGKTVSYSDCRYSDGSVYGSNGFTLERVNDPIYYYTKDYRKLEKRMGFQKSRLGVKFDDYDESLTEWENVKRNGYDRVWGCKTKTWTISQEQCYNLTV